MKNYFRRIFTLVLIVGSQAILHGGTMKLSEEMLNVLREVAVSRNLSPSYTDGYIAKEGEMGKLFLETYEDLWSKKGENWELKKDFLLRAKIIRHGCYRSDEFFECLLGNVVNYSKDWEIRNEAILEVVRSEVAYRAWFLSVYEIDLDDAFFLEMVLCNCLRNLFLDLWRIDLVAEIDAIVDDKF